MIVSFRHKGLRLFYETDSTRGIQASHAKKLRLMLTLLDQVEDASELPDNGFRPHPLQGSRAGTWSLSVNGNWRLTFRFSGRDVELLDYEDYH